MAKGGGAHLDEVTLISNTATTDVDLGTLLLAGFDVLHDTLERSYGDYAFRKRNEGERTSNWT